MIFRYTIAWLSVLVFLLIAEALMMLPLRLLLELICWCIKFVCIIFDQPGCELPWMYVCRGWWGIQQHCYWYESIYDPYLALYEK